MRVLILGGDGYLGWPTAMHLAARGHQIVVVDNYLRRRLARATNSEALIPTPDLMERSAIARAVTGYEIDVRIGDCADMHLMAGLFRDFHPHAVVHLASQPSGPYSMMGYEQARLTLQNNLMTTLNTVWGVLDHAADCHVVKLGTMGEYGTPGIDIEEGWIDIHHKGRSDRFLFPRQGGTLYHTTKIMDTDLLWLYTRLYGLRVTDLMQGPVYGLSTDETDADDRLVPNFHYDDIFGTVLNRFLVQAIAGVPLTVYGEGGQTRGYLNLRDTMQCITLAVEHPPGPGEMRIFNQFTELFSVNELAQRVARVGHRRGLDVRIEHVKNPRNELEDHHYRPAHRGLLEIGLEPTLLTDDLIAGMLARIEPFKARIETQKILPRIRWR